MKNRQAIILLFIANTVSGCAQGITMISIPWYFTAISKEALYGKIYLAVTFVSLFWGFIAGSFIDKYDRKKIFLVYNFVALFILAGISTYGYINSGLSEYLVGAVFATTVFLYNIHFPSYYAFAQEITENELYGKISSWLEIQNQFMFVLSGAIAAVLLVGTENGIMNLMGFHVKVGFDIQPWTIYEIFTIDACTYIVAITVIWFIRYESLHARRPQEDTMWERIMFGFKYLLANPGIFIFGVSSYVVFSTIIVGSFYMMPSYIDKHLMESGDVYATSEMYFALGSLLAGLIIMKLFGSMNFVKGIIFLNLVAAGIYAFCFYNTLPLWFYVSFFVIGLANSGIRILRVTYLFRLIPNDVIGRTGSIFNMINVIMRLTLTGILLVPFFRQGANIAYGMLLFSGAILIALVVLVLYYLGQRKKEVST